MHLRIFVTLKAGVLDPEGQAVARSLRQLGYDEIEAVRVGKSFEIEFDHDDPQLAMDRARRMCEQLLANPVLEDYEIVLPDEMRSL